MAVDIKKIIKQMTLEEKAGLCSGLDFWHTKPVERLGIPSIMIYCLNVNAYKIFLTELFWSYFIKILLKSTIFHSIFCYQHKLPYHYFQGFNEHELKILNNFVSTFCKMLLITLIKT